MLRKVFLAVAALALSSSMVSAMTFTITEGNNQNRRTVVGSTDIDVDSNGNGINLDALSPSAFGRGDVIGIYGRIVSAVDKFTYTFSSDVGFNVGFDFDGYEVFSSGKDGPTEFVDEGLSGLVDQSVVLSGDPDNANDSSDKKVIISLENTGTDEIISKTFYTNVTSVTAVTASIFADLVGGSYKLTIDGRQGGDAKNVAALYDLRISAVPLPAGVILLLSGLGVLGVARLRRKS